MGLKLNPLTAQFDLTGSGGGQSYIDGEVATYNDLPLSSTTAPLNTAWLVRGSSGVWPFTKPGGVYVRIATGGSSRDADYTYAGIFPDVFSDAQFTLYDDADSTKNAKFQLSGIATGTTRTITVPNKNVTLDDAGDFRTPTAHAASHASSGSDPVLLDQYSQIEQAIADSPADLLAEVGLNGDSDVTFRSLSLREDVNAYLAAFSAQNITANRSFSVPNASGTLALTSDIPAAFDPASPGTIGGTTPAAATFTNLTANTRLNLPNTNGTTAGDLYRNANTLRYRDSTNTERLLLNASDNLANLASASTARTNLGVGSSDAVTFGSIQGTPIGSTTPAAITGTTGTFTTLTATPAANTTALTSTGYSLTGSNAQSLVDLAGTWNTTGTPTALKLNVTNTASNTASLLLDLQTGGTSRVSVRQDGRLNAQTYQVAGNTVIERVGGFNTLNASCIVGWGGTGFSIGTTDLTVERDAADVMAQRRSTNSQESRLYGTFTSSTNYQRMTIKSVRQTLSALSGASATTTGTFIPDGAVVVGVTTRVATALTGATGYTIGDGTDADRWGDITGTAIGTTSDNINWTAGTIECFTAGGNVTLTAKGSNFTAGAIEICVFYLAGEAD